MWPVCFFVTRVRSTDAPFQKNSILPLNISEIILEVMDNCGFTACVNRQKTERCLLPVLRKKNKSSFSGCKGMWSDRSSLIPEEDSLLIGFNPS